MCDEGYNERTVTLIDGTVFVRQSLREPGVWIGVATSGDLTIPDAIVHIASRATALELARIIEAYAKRMVAYVECSECGAGEDDTGREHADGEEWACPECGHRYMWSVDADDAYLVEVDQDG